MKSFEYAGPPEIVSVRMGEVEVGGEKVPSYEDVRFVPGGTVELPEDSDLALSMTAAGLLKPADGKSGGRGRAAKPSEEK